MITAGGGSRISGAAIEGLTTVKDMLDAGTRPRRMRYASTRGDGASAEQRSIWLLVILGSGIELHMLKLTDTCVRYRPDVVPSAIPKRVPIPLRVSLMYHYQLCNHLCTVGKVIICHSNEEGDLLRNLSHPHLTS